MTASSTMVNFCHLKKQPLFLGRDPPTLHHSFFPSLSPEQSLIQFWSQWTFPIEDISHCGLLSYVAFCDWFFSLSIMFSRFVHDIVCISVSFLRVVKSYSIVLLHHICLLIYSLIAIWIISTFGLFQVLIRCTICKYFSHCMNRLFW